MAQAGHARVLVVDDSPHIWRPRNLIEGNPRRPRRILTWRGIGYRFVPVV